MLEIQSLLTLYQQSEQVLLLVLSLGALLLALWLAKLRKRLIVLEEQVEDELLGVLREVNTTIESHEDIIEKPREQRVNDAIGVLNESDIQKEDNHI